MEMRKFIVEIHPDGTVHATEYEEPGERLDIRDERLDIWDAIRKIDIECCSAMARAYKEGNKYALDAIEEIEALLNHVLNTYWGD